jgi:hypothetical protein
MNNIRAYAIVKCDVTTPHSWHNYVTPAVDTYSAFIKNTTAWVHCPGVSPLEYQQAQRDRVTGPNYETKEAR